MLYNEMKQKEAIDEARNVKEELINYMTKLKDICDEAMIGYSIQKGLLDGIQNAIFGEENGIYVVKRELYESTIKEVTYSPFSDTFSLFISNPEHASSLLERLEFLFQERNIENNQIFFDIQEDFGIIEITYRKDKYFKKHIEPNIKNIISLKPHTKNG